MSKTAQRNAQMYVYGFKVGSRAITPDYLRRARSTGWEAYKRGLAAGRLEFLHKQRMNSNPWLDFKAWMKRLFRKLNKRLHKKQIR